MTAPARLTALLPLALTLAACGAAPSRPPLQAPDAAAVLRHVPADTPYLLASLADAPPAMRDREIARLGQGVQGVLTALIEQAAVAGRQTPFDRLVLATAAALDGKLDGPGLDALGVGRHPRLALFGIDGLPALRIQVADGRRLEAVVDQVLTDAGLAVERAELDGQPYRVVAAGDLPLLYIAFTDRAMVAGILLPPVRDALLPRLLGQQPPATPLTPAALAARLKADGAHPSAYGWLKPAALLTPAWPMTRVLQAGAPETCVETLREGLGVVPELRFGARSADARELRSVLHVRLAPALRAALGRSLRPAPGLALRASGLDKAALAVGVDLPVALKALQGWGTARASQRSACPWFSGFDDLARQLAGPSWARLVAGVPAVSGLALVISRLEPGGRGAPKVDAAAWIQGPAAALFELMGDAVPGAKALSQAPAGAVVPLTLPLGLAMVVPEAHGLHREGGVGLAVGPQGRARLETLSQHPAPQDGPALVWHLEPAFMAAIEGADDAETWADAPAIAEALARFRALRGEGARSISGFGRLTPEGVTLEGWTEYAE